MHGSFSDYRHNRSSIKDKILTSLPYLQEDTKKRKKKNIATCINLLAQVYKGYNKRLIAFIRCVINLTCYC